MSSSKSFSYIVPPIMMWLLKLSFDQNSIIINYKLNDNFNNYIILEETKEKHKRLFIKYTVNL